MINHQDVIYQEACKLLSKQLDTGNIIEDIYIYTHPDGRPYYWRFRVRKLDGDKIIFPMSKTEDGERNHAI